MIYYKLLIPCFAWLLSLSGTRLLLPVLKRYGVVDRPGARSNHVIPTLRGGGAVMVISALAFLWLAGMDMRVLLAALVLALVSFEDDIRGLGIRVRLLAQLIAVGWAVQALPGRILPESVPLFVEYGFVMLAWLWFINLTNFMDGIDGLTVMQTIMMMVGICLLQLIAPVVSLNFALQATIIAAVAFGFYPYNRPPARVFMGDVGSIPLGFLIGYLLLSLAAQGQWAAALILPAYYIADATYTLLMRMWRGQKWWKAHSDHAYQRAVRAGMSHHEVVSKITLLNNVLVQLAIVSALPVVSVPLVVLAAYLITALVMIHFSHATAF